jgi:NADH-ubiquinone/plastoquinone oxidoreductase, chain 3
LLPWVLGGTSTGYYGFTGLTVFLIVLVVGFVYEFQKGRLDWNSFDPKTNYIQKCCSEPWLIKLSQAWVFCLSSGNRTVSCFQGSFLSRLYTGCPPSFGCLSWFCALLSKAYLESDYRQIRLSLCFASACRTAGNLSKHKKIKGFFYLLVTG